MFPNVLQRQLGADGVVIIESIHVPGQLPTPICFLSVSIDRCRGDVLFEPIQLRYKFLGLLLDIFGVLERSVSVVCDGHSLDQYLIMLDERAHAAKGGLERREPVGGLFRNVEEYLDTICNPLPLCWGTEIRQRAGRARC